MFAAIAHKNYEQSLWSSVLKPRNEMVQVALGVSFLTVVNYFLWAALSRGIIVNIAQQALMVVFEMSVFQYALKIFDPLQRWMSRDVVKKTCNMIKLVLGIIVLVLAVLIRVMEVYDVESFKNNYEYIDLYFLIIDFIVGLFVCYSMWVFSNIYITIRRGISCDSGENREQEPEEFDLRKRWMIDDINLEDFSPLKDPHCINVLKLEKIMMERLIFYLFLVLAMNIYKLSWGSSQYECSARVSCSPSITERNFQRAINNLSYWMPDLIAMVVWLLVLVKPIQNITLPEEQDTRDSEDIDTLKDLRHSNRERTDDLSCDDTDSATTGIKLSLVSNPLSADSGDANKLSFSSCHDIDRRATSSQEIVVGMQEYREVAVSCQEMILFHRESGIPVATLFAGVICFVVMIVYVSDYDTPLLFLS